MMCCFYPTTTTAIDDDIDFLNIITQHLGIPNCIAYSSPMKAIELLKEQNPIDRIRSRIYKKINMILEDTNLFPEDHTIVMNMRGLHEEIYNTDRFKDVSVIIVDYYMGSLNGIEVCEALSTYPAKKILLTGGADKEKVAIEAFNKGIIHRFINKSDPNFPSKLRGAISILQDTYFNDLNSVLLPYSQTIPRNIYQDPSYASFTNNILDQFDIVEHYMLDMNGSRLMLNKKGEPIWLIIKHESDMKNDEILARDQEASEQLINGITSRSLMPFFFSEEDYQQPASEWNNFFYSCQAIPGIENFYYSIYEGKIKDYINRNKIISYDAYLQSLKD